MAITTSLMQFSDFDLVLLFVPWAFLGALGHVAQRDFRAHLRRHHPHAYAIVYGAHANRGRHSAYNPVPWLLQLRFELSGACRTIGDRRLNVLGGRLRWLLLSAVLLYLLALGIIVETALPATVGDAQAAANVSGQRP